MNEITTKKFTEKGTGKVSRHNGKKTRKFFNRSVQDNSTVAVRYRHIRQACTHIYFRNIEKKGDKKRFFCFITPQTEQFLCVEVVTPILRQQNRMIKRLPVEVNILYKGQPILRWQRKIFWTGDGRNFMSEVFSKVGRALRLIHTEQVIAADGEAPVLSGRTYKDQVFKYDKNAERRVRRALLDV